MVLKSATATRRILSAVKICCRGVLPVLIFIIISMSPYASVVNNRKIEISDSGPVRAGSVVNVLWSQLPDNSREFELLMVVDLPQPLTVRLTESEYTRRNSYLWQVPNIPCFSARLVIRCGDGDERSEEKIWAISDSFQIEYDNDYQSNSVTIKRGELWLSKTIFHGKTVRGTSREIYGIPGGIPFALIVNFPVLPDLSGRGERAKAKDNLKVAPLVCQYSDRSPVLLQLRI